MSRLARSLVPLVVAAVALTACGDESEGPDIGPTSSVATTGSENAPTTAPAVLDPSTTLSEATSTIATTTVPLVCPQDPDEVAAGEPPETPPCV